MNFPILKFDNIFKSVIWGGERIAAFKNVPSDCPTVGESWEVSAVPGNESVVAEGPLAGKTLTEVIAMNPEKVLGHRVTERFGDKFPLLIKFIDSNDDLSIQVHPDDELARKRHNSLGKTEMWLSVDPAPGAYLYAGFKEHLTPEQFKARVAAGTIVDALNKFYPKPYDVFFLPAGRVHAIGRGNFVLEIQESSDITYRIYDYDRRDAAGNPRQLHLDESIDAIDYDDTRMVVRNEAPMPGKERVLEACDFFAVTLISTDANQRIVLPRGETFTTMTVIKGDVALTAPDGETTLTPRGTTVLLPASMEYVDLSPQGGSDVEIVTAFIPRP